MDWSHSLFARFGLLAKDWEDDVDLSSVIRDYDTQQLLGSTFVILKGGLSISRAQDDSSKVTTEFADPMA
jgi:hypothetical protein